MYVQYLMISFVVFAFTPASRACGNEPIISAIVNATSDDDQEVRYAAYTALNESPRRVQFVDVFWRGLEDESGRIRIFSLKQVVAIERPQAKVLMRLKSLLEKRDSTDERQMASAARLHLIAIGEPAIPYLIDSIKFDQANVLAIEAIGRIPAGEYITEVTELLTPLISHDVKAVRLGAVQALHKIMVNDTAAKAKAKMMAEAKDSDIDPRYLAYYQKLLQKYDRNSDGSLTKDEWSEMSKDPTSADANEDGKVTTGELAKWSMNSK